jgi:hypothetical protein
MEPPSADQLLASAINFLVQGEEKDAALVLLFCEASYGDAQPFNGSFSIHLVGPRVAYDAYNRVEMDFNETDPYSVAFPTTPIQDAVKAAFAAITPSDMTLEDIYIRVQLIDVQPGWREELREIAHGRRVHNQGVEIPGREIVEWGNMRFRSQSEARIAKALDTVGVLFLPNCLARLNNSMGRGTKEADFLVCANGKWGILEVDGPYHPRAADDHERDRLFQQHGIKVTQRFTSDERYSNAPAVVQKFLALLDRNG